MPRKRNLTEMKFYIPKSHVDKIKELVDGEPSFKDKALYRRKFYYFSDYINMINDDYSNNIRKDWVNINNNKTAKILGLRNNSVMTKILNMMKDPKNRLLKCDEKSLTGLKSRGYQFREEEETVEVVEVVSIKECKSLKENKLQVFCSDPKLLMYKEVLDKVRIDKKVIRQVVS